MLTFEIMGLLALGILWVNTLLIVGAALTPLGEHLRWLSRWRRQGLHQVTVTQGADEGVFARHEVEQTGHKAADDAGTEAILFHDRRYDSRLPGGEVTIDGDSYTLDETEGEVWVTSAEKAAAGAIDRPEDFDAAFKLARKAKGFRRVVKTELREGDTVYVHARLEEGRLLTPNDGPVMIASFDPRSYARGMVALVFGFQLMILALCGGITFLALYPPVFGTVSIIGGALGLLYFLTVQPLGVSVREMALLPPVLGLRGSSKRPASAAPADASPSLS